MYQDTARVDLSRVSARLTGAGRPRLLTVLNYYSPYVSGLSEHARLTAEGLVRSGFDVTVLCDQHRPDLALEQSVNGVRVVRCRPLFHLHKGIVSAEFVARYRGLAQKADVVHLRLPMLEAGLFAALQPRMKPLVATFHCDMAYGSGILDRLAVASVRASSRYCCCRADRITVTSHEYARGVAGLRGLESKCVEIYPPDKAPEGCPVRGPHAAGSDVRVGALGRFVREKGLDVLLEAFPLVLQRHPEARLVLGGDYTSVAGGSEYEKLRPATERLGDKVEVTGFIPPQKLFDYYRSLDVFVLPSVNAYEAFGTVQVEAMKAGVPVVASNLPGVRLPVQETGNGLLAAPGSPEALSDAISALIEHWPDPAAIASRAWRFTSARHTIAAYRQVLLDAIREKAQSAS
jgi:glycosyltransferase involved in cell wall biosynthesis